MVFDGEAYTREQLAIDLLAVEEHALNGSALEASCACIQERHLLALKGHCQEGQAIATNQQERFFYSAVHKWGSETLENIYATLKNDSHDKQAVMYDEIGKEAREIRVNLQDERWSMPVFKGSKHKLLCGCKDCPPCKVKIAD